MQGGGKAVGASTVNRQLPTSTWCPLEAGPLGPVTNGNRRLGPPQVNWGQPFPMSTNSMETSGAGQPTHMPHSSGQPVQGNVSLAPTGYDNLGVDPSAPIGYNPPSSGTKRSRSESDEDLSTCPWIGENWPRYLVLSSTDPNRLLTHLSPFAIEQGIKGIAGTPKFFRKLISGDLLVKITTKSHCQNLTNCAALVNIPIRVFPHRTLNFSRGVIRCKSLNVCSEQELLAGLSAQGVFKARCCMRKNAAGQMERTGTYFLDFNSPDLPSDIKICFENITILPYVPNPLRCYKCQRFGHSKTHCRKKEVCAKCCQENHIFENCPNEPFCVNCEGAHPASDKNCPQWKKEKEIQSYKTTNNCSFKEAREAIEKQTPGNKSWAAAATATATPHSNKSQSSSVQTNTLIQTAEAITQTEISYPSHLKKQDAAQNTDNEVMETAIPQPTITITEQQATTSHQHTEDISTNKSFSKVVQSPKQISEPTPAVTQNKPCTNMTVLTKKSKPNGGKAKQKTKLTVSPLKKFCNYRGNQMTRGSRFSLLADLLEGEGDSGVELPSKKPHPAVRGQQKKNPNNIPPKPPDIEPREDEEEMEEEPPPSSKPVKLVRN